jgi:excisionase family DNA binding protein
MKEPDWYSTTDVARLLGRSDRYVRDRVKRGELPAQEGGGGERKSYKISREALLGYLMANERRNTQEVEKILRECDLGYLRELELMIDAQMHSRATGGVQVMPKNRRMLRPVVALESRKLAADFVFPDWSIYERYYSDPMHLCASAVDTHKGVAEGHFSVEITTVEFFDQICKGTAKDDYQPPWQPPHTPILYIDCLILEDPFWAPFLFRDLCYQIKEWMRQKQVRIDGCFAIATTEESYRLLDRYGFCKVADFEGKHPIMLNRDITTGRLGGYLR